MRQLLLLICFIIFTKLSFGQYDTLLVKKIDQQILYIESKSKEVYSHDSSDLKDKYTETYFVNEATKKLAKVEFLITKPFVSISYYFSNNKFIKAIIIDESTSFSFKIFAYFKDEQLIFSTRRLQCVDCKNGATFLNANANWYLSYFKSIKLEN